MKTIATFINESSEMIDLEDLGVKPADIPSNIVHQAEKVLREAHEYLSNSQPNIISLKKILSKFPYWNGKEKCIGFGFRIMTPNIKMKYRPALYAAVKYIGEKAVKDMSNPSHFRVDHVEHWGHTFFDIKNNKIGSQINRGTRLHSNWITADEDLFMDDIIRNYDPSSTEFTILYFPAQDTADDD